MLVGAACMTGCRSAKTEYWLQVRNNAGAVVQVQYVADDGDHYRPLTEFSSVNPGEKVPKSPYSEKSDVQVLLQAETRDNPGFPARLPMHSGLNIVNITREEPSGKIKLEHVPRN